MVVSEGILVKVALWILTADRVIDAADSVLYESKEPLDRVGVNVAGLRRSTRCGGFAGANSRGS